MTKATPLPLHLAIQRTKATAAAEEGTLPCKKHFQFFYPTSVYSFCGKHTHSHPRATPSLNSSGAILSNVLPSLTEWAHSSEWGVEQAVLKRELLKELSKTK